MAVVKECRVPLDVAPGRTGGYICIGLLPMADVASVPAPLLDVSSQIERDEFLAPVQLLEATEYLFNLEPPPGVSGIFSIEPSDMFSFDQAGGLQGRLRTGLHTGTVNIEVECDGVLLGRAAVEVRSWKLNYVNEYRWMLRDIAEVLTELILHRFAPSRSRFVPDARRDAVTLYQRFAFLSFLFSGDSFETAMQQILSRPHRQWKTESEPRRSGQPVPASSDVLRQVTRPGPRTLWSNANPQSRLSSLPIRFDVQRSEETIDTPENRFVKFILEHFYGFVRGVEAALRAEKKPTAPVRRGLWEVQAVAGKLATLLGHPSFRQVGRMVRLPVESQVLQKRDGYRELFQSFIQFEAAAQLTWVGGQQVYGAGQRDVATLYEYWVFLQLAKLVAEICHLRFGPAELARIRPDGIDVVLQRGQYCALKGSVERLGRRLELQLWYNRTFGVGSEHSWTRSMRPDCSFLIRPVSLAAWKPDDEVWLHFDAKYRIEKTQQLFSGEDTGKRDARGDFRYDEPVDSASVDNNTVGLLKMHTYRDAIRRSAGAYAIYPGTESKLGRLYDEILPGIGAFRLTPTANGDVHGRHELYAFLDEALTHVATQVTRHERMRYWIHRASKPTNMNKQAMPEARFLTKPPADTMILLGYVRDEVQRLWIRTQKRYNLRAGERTGSVGLDAQELAAEFVLLYGQADIPLELWRVTGVPELWLRQRMINTGYRQDAGDAYFCLPLEQLDVGEWLSFLSWEKIWELSRTARVGIRPGAPVAVSWSHLMR